MSVNPQMMAQMLASKMGGTQPGQQGGMQGQLSAGGQGADLLRQVMLAQALKNQMGLANGMPNPKGQMQGIPAPQPVPGMPDPQTGIQQMLQGPQQGNV